MLLLAIVDSETGLALPLSAEALRILGFVPAVEADFYKEMLSELKLLLEKPLALPPEVAAIFEVFDYDTGTTVDSGPAEADLRERAGRLQDRFLVPSPGTGV